VFHDLLLWKIGNNGSARQLFPQMSADFRRDNLRLSAASADQGVQYVIYYSWNMKQDTWAQLPIPARPLPKPANLPGAPAA
jgi:hypothetical protein